MNLSIIAALAWIVTANILGLLPSRDNHWRRAYGLIAAGIPILAWVWWESGLVWALVFLAAGMSILRWPVIYLWRWLRRTAGR